MVKFHSILGGQLFEKIAKNEVKLAKIRKKSLYLTEPGVKTAICRKNLFGYSETSDYSLSDSSPQIFANSTPSTCKLDPKLGTFTKSRFSRKCVKRARVTSEARKTTGEARSVSQMQNTEIHTG